MINKYKEYNEYLDFKYVDFENLHKIYISGGEPLIIPQVYDFLQQCVDGNLTTLEILINTNATMLSDKTKKIIKYFSNLQFTISIDALDDVNYYIRFPSKWNDILQNINYLISYNHKISFNVTISLYNITRIFDILYYINSKYNGYYVQMQPAGTLDDLLSPYKYPDASKVLPGLKKALTLECCQTPMISSLLKHLILHYTENKLSPDLSEFYDFNDKLDKYRNIKLVDYIPELDRFR